MLINAFLTLESGINRWAVRLGLLLLSVSAILTFYQVLTRFVFQNPSEWSEVVARTSIIWMVYLGIGAALREGAMLSVRLLYDALHKTRFAKWLTGWISLCTVAFLAIAGWYGAQVAWAVRFQTLAGLEISISWAYLAIPVGCALGILATIAQTLQVMKREATVASSARPVLTNS
jgi:TRAP-type C4-dicarboxylate transport system, small permease component